MECCVVSSTVIRLALFILCLCRLFVVWALVDDLGNSAHEKQAKTLRIASGETNCKQTDFIDIQSLFLTFLLAG